MTGLRVRVPPDASCRTTGDPPGPCRPVALGSSPRFGFVRRSTVASGNAGHAARSASTREKLKWSSTGLPNRGQRVRFPSLASRQSGAARLWARGDRVRWRWGGLPEARACIGGAAGAHVLGKDGVAGSNPARCFWVGGREVEGARLEHVQARKASRGFESHPVRFGPVGEMAVPACLSRRRSRVRIPSGPLAGRVTVRRSLCGTRGQRAPH